MEEAFLVCMGVGGCMCSSCCGAVGFLSPSWPARRYKTLLPATCLSLNVGTAPSTRAAPGLRCQEGSSCRSTRAAAPSHVPAPLA